MPSMLTTSNLSSVTPPISGVLPFRVSPTAAEDVTALRVIGGNPRQGLPQDGRESGASGEDPGEAHAVRDDGV